MMVCYLLFKAFYMPKKEHSLIYLNLLSYLNMGD